LAFAVELQGSLTDDHFIKNFSAKADDYQLHLAEIKFNLGDQFLETNQLKLVALGQEIISQIKVTELLSRPQVTMQTQGLGTQLHTQLSLERQPKLVLRGTLKLEKLDLRAVATVLKLPLPETQDKTVFNTMIVETQLEVSPSQLSLTQLNINFDESTLKGELKVQNFRQPALSFKLNLDNIDVDRYLSSKTADKGKNAGVPVPMDVLKKLNINGTLAVTRFTMAKLSVKEMSLKFVTKEGKVKVSPGK
jgi:AsmA protein